jgi:hypothetical protein
VKRSLYLVFLLGLLLTFFLPAGTTWAAEGVKVDFTGNSVFAHFKQTDGCTETSAFVVVWDSLNRDEPGSKTRDLRSAIDIVQFDVCGQFPVFLGAVSGYAPIAEQDFDLSNGLESAALNTSFPVCDYLGNTGCFNVAVHLDWEGIGGITPAGTRQWHYDQDMIRMDAAGMVIQKGISVKV